MYHGVELSICDKNETLPLLSVNCKNIPRSLITSFAKEDMFLVVLVCLFVCLFVDNIAQTVMNGLG